MQRELRPRGIWDWGLGVGNQGIVSLHKLTLLVGQALAGGGLRTYR
jgi:hypothetical protein